MKKLLILFAIIGMALLVGYIQISNLRQEKWESDVMPASGAGNVNTNEDGPWNHRLLIATSKDGISWQKLNAILADQASVPDVIVDRDGNVRVYYVDNYNRGIVVAISNNLKNWSYIKVKGIPSEWVDPSIVILPDGRFRLYASYMAEGGQNKIVSAISTDGIHFNVEDGVRYESNETITDPEVIYANSKFVMYVQENIYQLERSSVVMLTSDDGLTFKYEGKVDVEGFVPCIIEYENGYRIYLHTEDFSIVTYFSKDLKNWENPINVLKGEESSIDRYGVVNPAVTKLPDGSYLMIYQTWIEEPIFKKEKVEEGPMFKEGEMEEEEKGLYLTDNIIDVEKVSGGCYLLKYPDFSIYIFRGECKEAKGKYNFSYEGVTFLFDKEEVYDILEKEISEIDVNKFLGCIEKVGSYIIILESEDGVNWKETEVVAARDGSVPDLIVGYDGKLYIYYVSFPSNKIELVTSENGIKWEKEKINLPSGLVDPEVALVNGTYRLYTNVGVIAESKDGKNFKQIGIAPETMDPTVFEINGKWYMMGWNVEGKMDVFSSDDGLTFKKERELEIEGGVCDAFKDGGEIYLYCHLIDKDKSQVILYKSKNGIEWEKAGIVYEKDGVITDPTVTFFKGKYYMALTVSH